MVLYPPCNDQVECQLQRTTKKSSGCLVSMTNLEPACDNDVKRIITTIER